MKRSFLAIALFISCIHLKAQQDYFIFIQETSRQPFYVRIGENSHSSSAGGHLILSPVRDTVFNMFIGFPRSRYPEQLFIVAVNKKDKGFELKNINGGWQLFDLQSLELLKPVAFGEKNIETSKKTDSYSQLMAGVVDDSAVLYTTVAKEETVKKEVEKKAEPVINEKVKTDSGALNKEVVKKDEQKRNEGLNNKEVVKKEVKPGADSINKNVVRKDEQKKNVGLNNKEIAKTEVVKTEETKPLNEKESEPVPARDSGAHEQARTAATFRDKRDIIRFITENVPEGKLVIYLDRTGPLTDTIRIIIPRL